MGRPAALDQRFAPPKAAMSVVWYSPKEDHDDNFFVILNKEVSVATSIGNVFPFNDVRAYTLENATTDDSAQVTRQRRFLNRGFTGTQGMGVRDENGQPIPVLKPGTHDPPVVSAMVSFGVGAGIST